MSGFHLLIHPLITLFWLPYLWFLLIVQNNGFLHFELQQNSTPPPDTRPQCWFCLPYATHLPRAPFTGSVKLLSLFASRLILSSVQQLRQQRKTRDILQLSFDLFSIFFPVKWLALTFSNCSHFLPATSNSAIIILHHSLSLPSSMNILLTVSPFSSVNILQLNQ